MNGKWDLIINEQGIKLKVLDILTKDDCIVLAKALTGAVEILIGIQTKLGSPYTNIDTLRSDYANQDIIPMRKQKKKERRWNS